jgi:propanol-preferring alcohol dehydrogenase
MRALVLDRLDPDRSSDAPLRATELPTPEPGRGEIRVDVTCCGVCHTELDEIEGRTPPARLPMVLGHEVVGRVAAHGPNVGAYAPAIGQRVGVAWIWSACGREDCPGCGHGLENLCPEFRATGRDAPGGYAESMVVPANFAIPVPDALSDADAAPLLCAGAVGYRALRATELEDGEVLGLTGFGASAHLVLHFAKALYPRSPVFVFARSESQREFALELGADWAGATEDEPPRPCDAIVDTTPAWWPILCGLERLRPGGRLVVNAIRKEAGDQDMLQQLDYARHLWLEKHLRSVANVTRRDVADALELAARIGLSPSHEELPLEQANEALARIRGGGGRGALVLRVRDGR